MKTDYFTIMELQAEHSLRAAELLERILADYKRETIPQRREEMHLIEHAGDEVRHSALRCLAKEFITPIERDDLLQLVQILDDVTDAIDDVVINLYMYSVPAMPKQAKEMAALMLGCVRALCEAVSEFRRFKRSERLPRLLVNVNTMEGKADEAYIEATRALFISEKEPLRAMGVKAVYDGLESCCDLCEHAADVMENVVMNNT